MRRKLLRRALLYLAVFFITAWTLAPYLWLIISSLSLKIDLLTVPLRWIPSRITLENYQALFFGGGATGEQLSYFIHALKNSLIITFLATVVGVTIGVFAAYALARLTFPGSRYYMLILLSGQMLPAISIIIPLYMLLRWAKLLDTYLGLVLVYSSVFLPLIVWIMRGYFATIPSELEDAARIDGCTRLSVLFRIVLPLSAPGLVGTVIFAFIAAWNEFLFALIFTNINAKTMPVLIGEFSSKIGLEYLKMAAAGVVASIPPVLLALLFQRFLIRGLTAGAVK